MSARASTVLRRAGWGLLAAGALAYALAAAVDPSALGEYPARALPDGLVVAAALLCLARVVARRESRGAWLALAVGLASWVAGDLYYSLALVDELEPPLPSAADALWLTFYPAAAVGLLALGRRRVGRVRAPLMLDGLIAAITVAAILIALAGPPILTAPGGGPWTVATILSYPIADLTLLAIVTGVAAATGWHPGRTLTLVAVGVGACAAADGYFAWLATTELEVYGTALDGLWPAGLLLIAFAAWRPAGVDPPPAHASWRRFTLPTVFAGASLGVLIADRVCPILTAAWVLAILGLLGAILSAGLVVVANERTSAARGREALTDALTGLGNRRRLVEDLREALADPWWRGALVLADLDDFKSFNDRFGHLAGDALLARLGGQLRAAAEPAHRAYRLGGDEFCVMTRESGPERIRALGAVAQASLSHLEGEVPVGCSWGSVALPDEATSVEDALRLADARLYQRKAVRLRSAGGEQARDVLVRALAEREAGLELHMRNVAELSLVVAAQLGVPESEHQTIAAAGQLHDIGKLAIPEEILGKPGPLEELEWVLMRRHTMVGERIVSAAPALGPVAALVRASHERWDGGGYPDGLRGPAIPLGARIVAVCDAFDAITSTRAYTLPRSPEEALAEVERCQGTQFDPAVVAALRDVVAGRAEGVRRREPA